mmetsp:Transcript_6123/g.10597  ORF Transcript_6123/g.10597 Transcript_6123/m.10597 type:complete len:262 (+) Transcript_6123:55-840(+)
MGEDASGPLAEAIDPEAGREIQFCPIRNLPISRGQRVRTLPAFHLLSRGAGTEALANGFYHAYGQQFPCHDLEYLHPDDKVYICEEDHKVFLNQMSMQYHHYICFELQERKAERKRLRERAAERKERHHANAAPEPTTQSPSKGSTARAIASQAAAGDDVYLDRPSSNTPVASANKPPAVAGVAKGQAAPASLAPQGTAAPAAAASVSSKPRKTLKPMAAAEDDEDLYGDVMEGSAKKQKTASTYAKAMTSILDDNFDEED